MKAIWFRPEHNKSQQAKENYTAAITNSTVVIDRLLEIIEMKYDEIEGQETSLTTYNMDAAYALAYLHGRKKTLKEIRDLFDFRIKT